MYIKMVKHSRKKNMKGGLNCADESGKTCIDEDGMPTEWNDVDDNGNQNKCSNFTRCNKNVVEQPRKSSFMDNTASRQGQMNKVIEDRSRGGRSRRKKRQNKSKKTRKNRK